MDRVEYLFDIFFFPSLTDGQCLAVAKDSFVVMIVMRVKTSLESQLN